MTVPAPFAPWLASILRGLEPFVLREAATLVHLLRRSPSECTFMSGGFSVPLIFPQLLPHLLWHMSPVRVMLSLCTPVLRNLRT